MSCCEWLRWHGGGIRRSRIIELRKLRDPDQAVLAGGNVRVGLEDNLWLEQGKLATNAQLVERAATIVTNMGTTLMTAAEVREKMQLKKREPLPA